MFIYLVVPGPSCGMRDLWVVACGIYWFLDPGWNPGPLHQECRVLATGPPVALCHSQPAFSVSCCPQGSFALCSEWHLALLGLSWFWVVETPRSSAVTCKDAGTARVSQLGLPSLVSCGMWCCCSLSIFLLLPPVQFWICCPSFVCS